MKVRGFSSFVTGARFGVTRTSSTISEDTGSELSGAGAAPQPQNNESMSSYRDEMFMRLRREAAEVVKREPILFMLLSKAGLVDANTTSSNSNKKSSASYFSKNPCHEPATSFEEVISRIVSHRLSSCSGGSENICPEFLRDLLLDSFRGNELELGHTMSEAVREDAMSIVRRDPACETLLEAVLFMKGFHSLVLHRAARRAWKPETNGDEGGGGVESSNNNSTTDSIGTSNENSVDATVTTNDNVSPKAAVRNDNGVSGRRFVALLLQSQSSSALGIDIHPACSIGKGVMIDHASGVVIGETAMIGDGTTILHGVTLGGTGKDHGVDRHPKIGKDVLIGAGTKILGNISVGDRAKIGAGSVVLRSIPSGATAVGAPAKIIGYTPKGERPGSVVDISLKGVEPLSGGSTVTTEEMSNSDSLATIATIGSVQAKERAEKGDQDDDVGSDTENATKKDVERKNSSDDDDDVTDFGTPAKTHYLKVSSNNADGLDPFRDSFRNVCSLKDSISHSQLRALLIQEGCTEGECVEVFFALLHCTASTSNARRSGCIPCEIFSSNFPEIAEEKTRLDKGTRLALAKGDLRALGMSKKASRRFRSMFAVLGKQCSDGSKVLTRIPSSSSLGGDPIPNKDRLSMAKHLDTDAYAEGITI
mmetsp:Transcript_6151/g.11228  ORF Transcript_6151/g.11228 Transcript_6151/m.11228 type:complete len:650 (+) Transcript_6151:1-1950(+)